MKCSLLRRGITVASIAVTAGGIALAGSLPASAATSAQSAPRSSSPSWARAVVLVNCRHHGVVEPRTYVLTCADGNDYLAGLHWVYWRTNAYASGVEHINTCVPNCAAGHFHRFRVLVTLWRVKRRGRSQWQFTRLTEIYPHNRPLRYRAHGKRYRPLTYTWHV